MAAPPEELNAAAFRTINFLQAKLPRGILVEAGGKKAIVLEIANRIEQPGSDVALRVLQNGFVDLHLVLTRALYIAVVGEAEDDPNFTDKGSRVRYSVAVDPSTGPFHIEAELWYEPIAYRWAHNLSPYSAPEPQRLVTTMSRWPQEARSCWLKPRRQTRKGCPCKILGYVKDKTW